MTEPMFDPKRGEWEPRRYAVVWASTRDATWRVALFDDRRKAKAYMEYGRKDHQIQPHLFKLDRRPTDA